MTYLVKTGTMRREVQTAKDAQAIIRHYLRPFRLLRAGMVGDWPIRNGSGREFVLFKEYNWAILLASYEKVRS